MVQHRQTLVEVAVARYQGNVACRVQLAPSTTISGLVHYLYRTGRLKTMGIADEVSVAEVHHKGKVINYDFTLHQVSAPIKLRPYPSGTKLW